MEKNLKIKEGIYNKIYTHIHAHNKYLTKAKLLEFTNRQLLAECHPSDREHFTKLLSHE